MGAETWEMETGRSVWVQGLAGYRVKPCLKLKPNQKKGRVEKTYKHWLKPDLLNGKNSVNCWDWTLLDKVTLFQWNFRFFPVFFILSIYVCIFCVSTRKCYSSFSAATNWHCDPVPNFIKLCLLYSDFAVFLLLKSNFEHIFR